jgi:two-component system CheB/CheR fusion protein
MAPANRELLAANRELTDTVDRLEAQSDDLRLSTASAQIATEEIETLNAELHSANEELETLNEETQANVEELNVANAELQSRAMELEDPGAAHDQEREGLAAILAGMGDAVLVVDRHGRVIRTNAAYDASAGVFGSPFVPTDERGVPLPVEATPQARTARGEPFRHDFAVMAEVGGGGSGPRAGPRNCGGVGGWPGSGRGRRRASRASAAQPAYQRHQLRAWHRPD